MQCMAKIRVSAGNMDESEYRKLRKHAESRHEEFYKWAQEALWAQYRRQQVRRDLPTRSK